MSFAWTGGMGRNGIRWVGPHWQTVGRLTLRLIVPPWALRADLEQATDADKQRIEPLVERDRHDLVVYRNVLEHLPPDKQPVFAPDRQRLGEGYQL